MRLLPWLQAGCLFALPAAPVAGGAVPLPLEGAGGLMAGKVETERTIELVAVVEASPAEVFRLWSTADGVRSFFAPGARIDSEPGGRYEILFAPERDPLGYSHGTTGARLLTVVPDRKIAFEWITFAGDADLGVNGPPVASRSLRDMRPLPTWVEVSISPVAGASGRTRVVLRHMGFPAGEPWGESFRWFGRAWAGVMRQLADRCRQLRAADGRQGRPPG